MQNERKAFCILDLTNNLSISIKNEAFSSLHYAISKQIHNQRDKFRKKRDKNHSSFCNIKIFLWCSNQYMCVDAGWTMPSKNFLFFFNLNWRKILPSFISFFVAQLSRDIYIEFFFASHYFTALKMIDSFFPPHSTPLRSTSLIRSHFCHCQYAAYLFQLFDVVFFAMTIFLCVGVCVCVLF